MLSLATERSWKNSQGEWESHVDWHRITCFGAVAAVAVGLRTGAHYFTGYLRSPEIEKNGTGRGKKNGAGAKAAVRAWEVRAIRIAKLVAPSKKILATTLPPTIPPCNPTISASPPGRSPPPHVHR